LLKTNGILNNQTYYNRWLVFVYKFTTNVSSCFGVKVAYLATFLLFVSQMLQQKNIKTNGILNN